MTDAPTIATSPTSDAKTLASQVAPMPPKPPIESASPPPKPTAPTRPMLDEKALRREGWQEGVPIVLCDGQAWMFPSPTQSEFRFREQKDGQTVIAHGFTLGSEYEAFFDAYFDAESGAPEAVALFELARYLLNLQYALPAGAAFELLRRGPSNFEMWEAIASLALGEDDRPKPSAVGSESA